MKRVASLQDHLTEAYLLRLRSLREYVTNLWAQGTFLHPFFTLHGPQHSCQVERIVGEILAPEHPEHHTISDIASPEELFYLLAAVWLHDVGMLIPPSLAEKNEAKALGMTEAAFVRHEHNARSREYVFQHHADLGLNRHEASYVGQVCEGHRVIPLHKLSDNSPNLRFLCATLRIADELDITAERAPVQLLELRWSDMDNESRWHWLRHWCVVRATAFHEVSLDRKPATTCTLSYQYTVSLPSESYLERFWREVIKPIQVVLEDEGVGVILAAKHLVVDVCRSWPHVIHEDPKFPDGEHLSTYLDLMLPATFPLSSKIEGAIAALNLGNQAASSLLWRISHGVTNSAVGRGSRKQELEALVFEYLHSLESAFAAVDIEHVCERFRGVISKFGRDFSHEEGATTDIENRLAELIVVGERVISICRGEHGERRKAFLHLVDTYGSEINEVSAWLCLADRNPDIRQDAATALGRYGTGEFCEAIYEATLDSSPGVRLEAVRAFRRLNGLRTMERLGQISGSDVDGAVREEAKAVLTELILNKQREPNMYKGKKALLIDKDGRVGAQLYDMLSARGIDMRAVDRPVQLAEVLNVWKPDVVVCELLPSEPKAADGWGEGARLPGLQPAKEARRLLGSDVPMVATSAVKTEEIAAELRSIGAIHIKRPNSITAIVRAIESLMSTAADP